MKIVMAIVKPFKLDDVCNALTEFGIQDLEQAIRICTGETEGEAF